MLRSCHVCDQRFVSSARVRNRKWKISMALRTMIFKLKYVSSNDAVLHTEDSKTELDLKRNPTDFYVDFVGAGSMKRAPFVLRRKYQVGMLWPSESRSLLVRIIQRVKTFKKASVNIVFEKATESTAPGISGSTISGTTASAVSGKKCPRKQQRKQVAYLAHPNINSLPF